MLGSEVMTIWIRGLQRDEFCKEMELEQRSFQQQQKTGSLIELSCMCFLNLIYLTKNLEWNIYLFPSKLSRNIAVILNMDSLSNKQERDREPHVEIVFFWKQYNWQNKLQ